MHTVFPPLECTHSINFTQLCWMYSIWGYILFGVAFYWVLTSAVAPLESIRSAASNTHMAQDTEYNLAPPFNNHLPLTQ